VSYQTHTHKPLNTISSIIYVRKVGEPALDCSYGLGALTDEVKKKYLKKWQKTHPGADITIGSFVAIGAKSYSYSVDIFLS
jgi:hypothetical protein